SEEQRRDGLPDVAGGFGRAACPFESPVRWRQRGAPSLLFRFPIPDSPFPASRMRIIFAGTPEFAVPSLVAAARRNEVVAVYTQPDRPAGRGRALSPSPVKRAALERGIEVFQPGSLKTQVARDALAALKPDLLVVVAYGL